MAYYTSSVMLDPVVMDNNLYFDDVDRTIFDEDEENVLKPSRGRTDLRAHLDDLARRHPEFAEHLRSPPGWVSDFHTGSSSGGSASGGGPSGEGGGSFYQETHSEAPASAAYQSNSEPSGKGLSGNHLAQGLRNTDPEIGLKGQAAAKEDRNQRSMSAPPDGRSSTPDKPHRFVSKIEINPVNPATGETAASSSSAESGCGKPPMAPPKPQQQTQSTSQPQQSKQNVRHIPIFVEGRDEPVLPKNVDQDFGMPSSTTTRQQQFHPQQHSFSNGANTSQPPPAPAPPPQQQAQRKPTQPPHFEQPKPQECKVNEHVQQSPPTCEAKQKMSNDPISQVQQVQNDVQQLRVCVNEFKGTSRTDKEYMFLDEMLTRNLIKLDNVETDGKENVRAARKEAIKSVQQCISLLESKVPQTPSIPEVMDVDETTTQAGESASSDGQPSDASVNKMDAEEQGNENQVQTTSPDQSNSTEVKC